MPWTPDETGHEGSSPVAALLRALREDAVQDALDAVEVETGLARERIIAEAVKFAGRERAAFVGHLRGAPARRADRPQVSRLRRFLGENGIELVVAGMFLLGAALAAIQIMLHK